MEYLIIPSQYKDAQPSFSFNKLSVYNIWAFLFPDSVCNFIPGGHFVTVQKNTESYLGKEMSAPKFEQQNEKLLLTTLRHYCLSCLRFVAFTVAKTFQNTLVKWS